MQRNFEQQLMQDICRYIENNAATKLELSNLAKQAQLSPAHFQKRFKAVIGVSPKEYQDSCRLKNLKRGLKGQNSTTAIYNAGFCSPSAVYGQKKLGMTPKQYGKNGKGMKISYATTNTPIGRMMIAATDHGLCFLQFGESDKIMFAELEAEFPEAEINPSNNGHKTQYNAWMNALNEYLSGNKPAPNLPLDIFGTAFQMKVWKYLQTIPAGTTKTYSEVAEGIGHAKAVRAVGTACGSNNVSIVIPCHRVIRGSGSLAGYRWGLDKKQKLLALEIKS